MTCELLHNYQQHCLSICLCTEFYQEVLLSYPQLLLVLVVTSIEYSVSYNNIKCSSYYVVITAENNLVDVFNVIDDIVNWEILGLQLGLRLPTLEKIGREQRGIIDNCKTHMLSAWLQQQDNVSKKGIPSWSVLKAALKRMGEHETADRIHSN